ncbi:MAG: hypothetical protein ABIA74_05075 [bacterium]
MKLKNFFILSLIPLFFASGCLKDQYKNDVEQKTPMEYKPLEKQLLESEEKLSVAEELAQKYPEEQSKHTIERRIQSAKEKIIGEEIKRYEKKVKREEKRKRLLENKSEIDFEIENLTGKTKYIVCFTYIKQEEFTRWRWDKSEVIELKDGESIIVDVDTIADKLDRDNVYGYLGIFDDKKEAEDSIYQLLPDENKIDIDKLINLKGKKVVIGIEKYGFKKENLDFRFVSETEDKIPELDFIVENQTGRPLWLTCFVYQKKADHPVWQYDKTPVKKLMPNDMTIIDVDPISEKYDRVYLRGVLGIFDETEEQQAKDVTYELLPENNKIELYRLMMLRDKKVVLEAERYGIIGDIIKFDIKPIRKIEYIKANEK